MIRISGINLNPKKQIRFVLTIIKGIGPSNVKIILKNLGINPTTKLGDLDDQMIVKLRTEIDSNYVVESDLRRFDQQNIKKLVDIKSYRGLRHLKRLPVRGQRTKTNSRTVRGNVRSMAGSGRIKASAKK